MLVVERQFLREQNVRARIQESCEFDGHTCNVEASILDQLPNNLYLAISTD